MTDATKLQPCPFCGAPARVDDYIAQHTGTKIRTIQCNRPGIACVATGGKTLSVAVRRWNKMCKEFGR